MSVLAQRDSLRVVVTEFVNQRPQFTPRKLAEFAADLIKGVVVRGGTINNVTVDENSLFTWLFDVRFVDGVKQTVLLESSPKRDHAILSFRDQQYVLKKQADLAAVLGPLDPTKEQSWKDRFAKPEAAWAAILPADIVRRR